LPETQSGDAVTERLDGARDLGSRRVLKFWHDLISVAQGKRVEEIEPDRRYLDADLAWSSAWLRRLFEAERLWTSKMADLRHPHRVFSPVIQHIFRGLNRLVILRN
jgi:hypothetical protein